MSQSEASVVIACGVEWSFDYSGRAVRGLEGDLFDMDQNIRAKIGCPMAWWIKARVTWPMR